ncbi:N(2)-acetyl-L-2,4-diaminobutanoate deacetylase DoeB [Pseudomonas nitroreducens]|uniref:N(2)-acetyl-L-2,4-diaminobutanoate deacetylase DoeB n=1 Tax=Pseudomonas nitroreducens TaxID=46680 RepID=UPI0009FC8BC2|nr:N(2)-acetyl-L-2,4-diaminobutanoate deacetylase DoeB [Pseudomonas nitroreducens]MCJ1879136.1 N(2)-acetyl-L-2,4-diaminobutanoate deacetylase DoeB [Pseudomonas nitroreducens]MCJ1896050.1 N(2)-acetyl-L-2,4-diaminobutanoate deacetylase DoeB [Pseudomonas nitroreducens]NMZ60023.1 N-alpha-acetyl diaminobutyric acid deacetylase DoeB [Pseudomonas nitroreducens]SNS95804.1 N-alpha-acetyl-L-2,4-diaminobutyrate deacetylase [Pseudomonas nitroreducens]
MTQSLDKELRENPIAASVDFQRDGVQHGHLKLPYSRDDSAWGAVMIPVCVVKNGDGPTALLTGGNHGDEYEGPVALSRLAQELRAEDVRGRVIIVPFMNTPAFHAGKRTSPIDAGNLNRSFPGRPDGTVTQKIADYFQRTLLPLADVVLDIHSGGRTLDFLPFAACHVLPDKAQQEASEALMRAFAAPYAMRMLELDAVGMYDSAAEEQGKLFVTTELGGGGTSSARTVAIARRGVRNLLVEAGILCGEIEPAKSVMLDMPDADCFVASEHGGLLEMCRDLGERVERGEVLARVHDVLRTGAAPVEYRAKRSGILAARHFPGLVQSGDTLAVVAEVLD